MLTVTEALERLPEKIKVKALAYHREHGYDKHSSYNTVDNCKSALVKGFNWHKTTEGWQGWFNVFNFLKYKDWKC